FSSHPSPPVIYTLSLHDALPILLFSGASRFNEFVVQTTEDPYAINSRILGHKIVGGLPLKKFYPELGNAALWCCTELTTRTSIEDRKSTRLNSSHRTISYAVFCL